MCVCTCCVWTYFRPSLNIGTAQTKSRSCTRLTYIFVKTNFKLYVNTSICTCMDAPFCKSFVDLDVSHSKSRFLHDWCVFKFECVCINIYIKKYTCVCTHMRKYILLHIYMCVWINIYMYAYIWIYIYIYMYMYIYINI